MKSNDFPFIDDPATACFVCRHVLEKSRPILFVSHEADDGAWQFLCNFDDHGDDDIKIIALEEAVEMDPTIGTLSSMPKGFAAIRTAQSLPWHSEKE
jgi:hypothetical protein